MCYYNGIKVIKEEHIRLKQLERKFAFLGENLAIHKGFDYGDFPVKRLKANSKETERVEMQWGFLPIWASTSEKIEKFRKGYKDVNGKWHKPYTTFNATSEEMLNNMYQDAALHRRCLIPSTGFFEWMHVPVVGKSGKLFCLDRNLFPREKVRAMLSRAHDRSGTDTSDNRGKRPCRCHRHTRHDFSACRERLEKKEVGRNLSVIRDLPGDYPKPDSFLSQLPC